jgi:uncharacterized protein (TIGR03083 family)
MTYPIGLAAMARQHVADIPKLTHVEATELAQTEYERLLSLLQTLAGDDWQQPTYCSAWTVREMVAHLAGAVTGWSSFAQFRRQSIQNPYLREFDQPIDGINKLQVVERADKAPADLVAEFRENGPKAIANRQKLPWPLRKIVHLPFPPLGRRSLEYLADTIYPRDQWMHRYDICAATGKKMVVSGAHDGRIVALVLLDIAEKLKKQLAERNIVLRLTGAHSSEIQFGEKATVDGEIAIDFFDFNLLASGRIGPDAVMERAAIGGDRATALWFLNNVEVPY